MGRCGRLWKLLFATQPVAVGGVSGTEGDWPDRRMETTKKTTPLHHPEQVKKRPTERVLRERKSVRLSSLGITGLAVPRWGAKQPTQITIYLINSNSYALATIGLWLRERKA
jgi:hypothetical protein